MSHLIERVRSPFLLLSILTFCIGISSTVIRAGQPVRLRANITPDCSSTIGSSARYADIYAEGDLAVQGSYGCRGVFIYDVSNPDDPQLASWYNPGNSIQFLEAIILNGRGYFGSGNQNGVHIVDLSDPKAPQLLGIANPSNGGAYRSIHEMVVFEQNGSIILIENDNEGANFLKAIDVTNPAAPVFIRNIDPQEVNWVHAMHVRGNRMFTSGWGTSSVRARTEIWDISDLLTRDATILGTIQDQSSTVNAGNNMHTNWSSEDGNFLYSAREIGNSNAANPGDIRVYDISTPATPILVKKISMADLGINASTPHNPVVMGDKLYVSWYHAGLQVFDLADPRNPRRIGQYDTYESQFTEEQRELMARYDPADIMCGRSISLNSAVSGYEGAWAVFPFLGEDRVLVGDLARGLFIVDVTDAAASDNLVSDFDGDNKTDISIFRPGNGDWEIENSSDHQFRNIHFGQPGDIIEAGDYDGDGSSDPAVFRPSTGIWYMQLSTTGYSAFLFGTAGDVPVAADYDGDGRTDVAVWRPSNGIWYIQRSTLGFKAVQWGLASDRPITGDYDQDGKADVAVWRPSTGTWYILQSTSSIPLYENFGSSDDQPLSGDFDGNGVTDLAVYRPSTGTWYILDRSTSAFRAYQFGVAEDMPIPADYDGDGSTDIAVFRPSTNAWYRLNSSDGQFDARVFGLAGDLPSPSSVQPQ
jgi:hypothetical protein